MSVEMHRVMPLSVRRPLMKTHGVREAHLEEVVIARSNSFEHRRKSFLLIGGEIGKAAEVPAWQHERLEGPDGPVRHQGYEVVVLDNDSGIRVLKLRFQVITQEA